MSLQGSLQENLITMLVYNETYASLIRNSVAIGLWSVPYRIAAARCYEYIDSFKVPPKDHIADLLEDKIIKDDGEAAIFRTLLLNMRNASSDGINADYVLKRLDIFIRRQSWRTVSVDLTKALQRDTEESLEEADRLITNAKRAQLQLFDPGTRLSDKAKALKFLDFSHDSFPTGIAELDKRNFGPTRKELWMGIGDAKSGKTQLLIHLAKIAIINRLRVAHITLEMSEAKVSQRYFQTLFSVAKRREVGEVTRIKKDADGNILEFGSVKLTPRHSLQDPDIRQRLEKYIDKWGIRQLDRLFVKEFTTGKLTVSELNAYLDSLEATKRFTPDMIIVDYPDLMKTDPSNYRLSIDQIYKDLRGMAVDRNLAMVVVSQSNRGGAKKKVLGSENIAEAYSKVQHADLAITLSATSSEKKLGLARLYVTNARNDEGNLTIVISQNYRTSTFAVDAAVMPSTYWGLLGEEEDTSDE